jgi:UDP-N-acetylglucosamine 4,6-dehydratase/5-epimerase
MDTCLITGGTGTFGSAYVITAIKNKWHKKIIVYSRDEYKQIRLFDLLKTQFISDNINKVLPPYSLDINGINIRFFIGDVCDYDRLVVATKNVDIVIHAAALKHVPICEYNPISATQINVGGTVNVVNACGNNNVKMLLALSTDKAVDPLNLYGASKLCLEKVVLGGNIYYPDTIMNVVRYGNIIGSRGSIIHKLLVERSEQVQLTDPTMTRFWLTIEEAVQLVNNCMGANKRHAIYVPSLKSLRLDTLFNILRPDVRVDIIGSRPGEKVHEKMITETDLHKTVLDKKFNHFIINMCPDDTVTYTHTRYSNAKLTEYTSNSVDTFTKEEFSLKVKNSIINNIL